MMQPGAMPYQTLRVRRKKAAVTHLSKAHKVVSDFWAKQDAKEKKLQSFSKSPSSAQPSTGNPYGAAEQFLLERNAENQINKSGGFS